MRLLPIWLLVCLSVAEGEPPANWSANYPPCNRHAELLRQGHMDVGVRVATANPFLAEQFRRALDSWARILDMDWHEDDTQNCQFNWSMESASFSNQPPWRPDRSCLTGPISRAGLHSIQRRRSVRPICTGYRYTRSGTCSACSTTRTISQSCIFSTRRVWIGSTPRIWRRWQRTTGCAWRTLDKAVKLTDGR